MAIVVAVASRERDARRCRSQVEAAPDRCIRTGAADAADALENADGLPGDPARRLSHTALSAVWRPDGHGPAVSADGSIAGGLDAGILEGHRDRNGRCGRLQHYRVRFA